MILFLEIFHNVKFKIRAIILNLADRAGAAGTVIFEFGGERADVVDVDGFEIIGVSFKLLLCDHGLGKVGKAKLFGRERRVDSGHEGDRDVIVPVAF